jgi:hypothetical protein
LSLAELLVGVGILLGAILTLLASLAGQLTVNEHARNLSWATHDATRVLERLRRQNSEGVCAVVNVAPPTGFPSWDAWLADASANGGGGKSMPPNPLMNELVVVTPVGVDPVAVTVAACWRHRGRVVGECIWDGATLTPNPGAGGDPLVTESPASLSTLITCRG